jgi:hypothetical protein
MKPSIGRVVIVRTSQTYNGSNEHPAIVNRVWGTNDPAEAKGAHVCINVSVLPDCAVPFCATSISLFETKAEAEASGNSGQVAWWPERT